MKLRKVLSAVAAAAVATSALAVAASAADYNGYIAFQTSGYSFRNAWDDASYGKATPYHNGYVVWGEEATDPDTYPGYEDNFDYDCGAYVLPATYNDVAITADGTYTVEAKDLDWAVRGDSDLNLAFLSTDIPTDIGVEITNATVYVDGTAVKTIDAVEYDTSVAYVAVHFANAWTELGTLGAYPTESLKIEFTVSGLGGGEATEAPAEEAPATGDVDASTDSTKGSPDTGVADVAAVAGLAVLAGGAFIVAKKRK